MVDKNVRLIDSQRKRNFGEEQDRTLLGGQLSAYDMAGDPKIRPDGPARTVRDSGHRVQGLKLG